MSKKGAFIYQQIEQTTAEWADNVTVYPASVWLFERLENGKFNMKLADGVHTFAQLPAVMQEVKVTVKTNDATTYILTITTAEGKFDTPNQINNVIAFPGPSGKRCPGSFDRSGNQALENRRRRYGGGSRRTGRGKLRRHGNQERADSLAAASQHARFG